MAIRDEQYPLGFKKTYLTASNSSITPQNNAAVIAQGGVPARGAAVQAPPQPKSLDEFLYGPREIKPQTITPKVLPLPIPEAQPTLGFKPQPAVAAENLAINTPQQIRAGINNGSINSQTVAPGTGFVVANGSGSPSIAASPSLAENQANQLIMQSQDLMNAKVSGPVTNDSGQLISEGSQAVGNGIVARGLLNRAKILTDISNANASTALGMRRANNEEKNNASLVADRNQDNQLQQQQFNLGARKANLEINQLEQLDQLKNSYLSEPDPIKKQALSEQISTFTGRSTEKYQPIMGKDDMGNPVYLGAFNARTGEATNQPGTKMGSAGNQAPAEAIALLKANPQLADQFKAKYGYLPQ